MFSFLLLLTLQQHLSYSEFIVNEDGKSLWTNFPDYQSGIVDLGVLFLETLFLETYTKTDMVADLPYFAPFQSDYGFSTGIVWGPIEVKASHNCLHPNETYKKTSIKQFGGENMLSVSLKLGGTF